MNEKNEKRKISQSVSHNFAWYEKIDFIFESSKYIQNQIEILNQNMC